MSAGPPTHRLFLVPSANHAVQGEAALLRAGIRCRLIPVPRSLSSQCGVCLSVSLPDRSAAAAILRASGTATEGVHDVCLPAAGGAGEATMREEASTRGEASTRKEATTRGEGTAGTDVTEAGATGSEPPSPERTQLADPAHRGIGDEGGNDEWD